MQKCYLKSDIQTAAWFEEEIKKIDSKILELKIARPALRALVSAKIYTVQSLQNTSIPELRSLHGMGPAALKKLETLSKL